MKDEASIELAIDEVEGPNLSIEEEDPEVVTEDKDEAEEEGLFDMMLAKLFGGWL